MKYAINMQGIKALSLAALLISTSQTVYSATVVGKDVPAFQETLSMLRNSPRRGLEKNPPPTLGVHQVKISKILYINMPHKDLRGATITIGDTVRFFYYSNLAGSNLTGASLSNANLALANLTNATLTNANLSNAILTNATLTNATFTNANLTGALLWGANFSGVKGLIAEQKAYARSKGALNVPN